MVLIPPDTLESFAYELTLAVGAPPDTARAVAGSLVGADRRGHDSHGVLRLPLYADHVATGAIDPDATPVIVRESPVTATIDGRYSFGQVVGRHAVDLLAEKATDHGLAAIGIRNATHLGRLGEWAERTVDSDLLFYGCISGSVYTVAPAGSYQRRLSTNPIAFGVPTFDALPFPLILDMATSQVAHGKIRKLAIADEPIPTEWTVTAAGNPVTDSVAFEEHAEGAILPLGGTASGYKGYGLSIMVELFSSTLGDAPAAGQAGATDGGNDGVFFAIDPVAFTSRAAHATRVAELSEYLKSAEYPDAVSAGVAAHDGDGLLPGEPEYELFEAQRTGIDLADRIAATLSHMARDHGVADAIPDEFDGLATRDMDQN